MFSEANTCVLVEEKKFTSRISKHKKDVSLPESLFTGHPCTSAPFPQGDHVLQGLLSHQPLGHCHAQLQIRTTQPLTSLSSDASRCNDRSDIRKCRVVSAVGCGPGFSGAYWTFRMTKRTEFLSEEEPERGVYPRAL